MEKTKHIVILAAGDFPTHPVPLQALREADFVVCCDSAYSTLLANCYQLPAEYVVIGDGDSLPDADKHALGDRWIHVAEQDYNDLHKAMAYATSHFSPLTSSFSILGATGRREDHTIGNISYLVTFGEEYPGADIAMLTDHGRFIAIPPLYTLHSALSTFPGQQVSIFNMERGFSSKKCPCHFQSGMRGILNEPLVCPALKCMGCEYLKCDELPSGTWQERRQRHTYIKELRRRLL